MTELDPTGDPGDTRPHDSPASGTERNGDHADPDDARTQVITTVGRAPAVPAQAGAPAAENLFDPAHRAPPTVFAAPPTVITSRPPGPVGPAGPGWGYGGPAPGPYAPYGAAPGHAGPAFGSPAPTPAAPPWAAGYLPPPTGAAYPPPAGLPGVPPPPPGFSPAPPGGARRWTTVLVALVAVVVLVAGGVAVYLTLRGGGAATPAEATKLLSADLQSADYASAVTRLHPDEVRLGTDLGGMFHDELVRLEILRPDADPKAAFGDVTFAGLTFDDAAVEQVRPGVAIAKLVGGTVTVTRDVNTLPITDSYKRLAYPNGVPAAGAPEVVDIAKVVADQGRPVRVATVQVDGEWYVSLAYTLADNALVQEGRSWPQTSIAPRGAATAQDALRDTVTALFDQDARRLVELAPPHELAVVHDLGPLLVESAGTPQPSGTRLVDLSATETAVAGGTALTVDRLVAVDAQGRQFTVVRDGDCLAVTAAGSPGRVCADDLARQGVTSVPGATDPAVRDVITRAAGAALALRVVVVDDDGQYYVSPVRTLAGVGVDVLHTLQPTDLAQLAAATG